MRTSESTKELVTALSHAQSEFRPMVKDAENPFFKSKYADLATLINSVQETLGKHELAVTQHLESEFQSYYDVDGTIKGERLILCVVTRLEHSSGEFEESTLRLPVLDSKPQTLGSASSYARRYALQSILRLAAELDDDGNAASLQENWSKEKRDQYIAQKKAALRQEIDEAGAQASKSNFKKQLEASVKDLGEAKVMEPERQQPEKPRPQPKDPSLITDLQRKMIFAIAQKRGLSDADMLEALGSVGYEHLSELPKSRVSALLDTLDPDFRFHQRSSMQ